MKPKTTTELAACVKEVWKTAADPRQFQKYMRRLNRNVLQVIKLQGGNKYKENMCKKCIVY